MTLPLELVADSEPAGERSPLASARLRRRLTLEEAARRAGLPAEQLGWLEEGRVYRFQSTDAALLATILYASALRIDQREAAELAGLAPAASRPPNQLGRLAVLGAVALAASALAGILVLPGSHRATGRASAAGGPALTPPWRVHVDVLNGGGDINYTRRVADRILGLAYRVDRVGRADRFDYTQSAVYYEPGGVTLAVRLARSLGIATRPLPGGHDPRRLVVIVGPERGPGD